MNLFSQVTNTNELFSFAGEPAVCHLKSPILTERKRVQRDSRVTGTDQNENQEKYMMSLQLFLHQSPNSKVAM